METYLLELSRYVVLNPVRARMVEKAEDWPWSSYRATLGMVVAPRWLAVDWLLSQFDPQRSKAVAAYVRFVAEGVGKSSPLQAVRHQVLLGNDLFVARLRGLKRPEALLEVPKVQRRPVVAGALADYAAHYADRREAMARAYRSGAYSMREIAEHFGVHYMTVSRAVRRFERLQVLECEA